MDPSNSSDLFDANYYATSCGRPYQRDSEWLDFFDKIAQHIASDINPGNVLDAGCAYGFLVERLRERGIAAFGLDISPYAIQNVYPDIQPFVRIGSVTEPFPQRYDLIVSIEVLEHLHQPDSERAIENLCQYTDDILFSSTPFDYEETTHFNVQPPGYWAEHFARHGFFRDIEFDASFVTPWAARFRKNHDTVVQTVHNYEQKVFLLGREISDLKDQALEMQAEINGYKSRLSAKENEVNEIFASRSWQLIQRIQAIRLKLIPPGSRREKWFLGR